VGGVRLGVWGVVLVVCVCFGVGGDVLCRCVRVCVCDLLIFLHLRYVHRGAHNPTGRAVLRDAVEGLIHTSCSSFTPPVPPLVGEACIAFTLSFVFTSSRIIIDTYYSSVIACLICVCGAFSGQQPRVNPNPRCHSERPIHTSVIIHRGAHNPTGRAVLRDAVEAHLVAQRVGFERVPGNSGQLRVFHVHG